MNEYIIGGKKILLYGAASRGSIVKDICERNNCRVFGFIDQRAAEIKQFCNLPVYSLTDLADNITDKDDFLIYINLKNVFEHDKVALQLLDIGFHNILFRPGRYLDGTGNKEEYRLNECYDLFVTADKIANISVPVIKEIRFPEIKDTCLINAKSTDGTVIIKCPTPLLYSDYVVPESKWTDKNIYSLKKLSREKFKSELFKILGKEQLFGDDGFYQSLPVLGIKGARPSDFRIKTYRLDKIVKDRKVLDIGNNCGFLDLSIDAKSITGVEYAKNLVDVGNTAATYLELNNVHFEQGDFTKWECKEIKDVVLNFAVHGWINMSAEKGGHKIKNILYKRQYVGGGVLCLD